MATYSKRSTGASGAISIMMSMSLFGRIVSTSPAAEQGSVSYTARPQGGLVLLQRGDDIFPFHDDIIAETEHKRSFVIKSKLAFCVGRNLDRVVALVRWRVGDRKNGYASDRHFLHR